VEIEESEMWGCGSDSSTTAEVAYGSICARCCNYSLLALLMMGDDITRNMYSSFQGIKTVQSRILLDSYWCYWYYWYWFTMHGPMNTKLWKLLIWINIDYGPTARYYESVGSTKRWEFRYQMTVYQR
jgi:hypothetical protein